MRFLNDKKTWRRKRHWMPFLKLATFVSILLGEGYQAARILTG
jgi:hypothetical protein